MLIFPFQSNSKGSLLCVQSELYIPRILKEKANTKILLHLGTNDPTSFFLSFAALANPTKAA